MKPAAAVVMHRGTQVRIYGPLPDRKREVYLLAYHNGSRRRKQSFQGSLGDAKKKAKEVASSLSGENAMEDLRLTPLDRLIYGIAEEAAAPTGLAVDTLCREAAAAMRIVGNGASLYEVARYWAIHHPGAIKR